MAVNQPIPQSQPVPTRQTRSATQNITPSKASKVAASPMSYGPMTGISFQNGGGFSLEGKPKSVKWGTGDAPNSYGGRFYGDALDSPLNFATSITMGEPSSYVTSSAAFNLPGSSLSSSYQRRSYAAAARGIASGAGNLSSSFASMSFQPMSFGSYSKNQVHHLMQNQRTDAELTKAYECCDQVHEGLHALLEHVEDAHPFADPDVPQFGHVGFSPMTHAMDLTHAMDMDMEGVGPTSGLALKIDDKDGGESGSASTTSLSPPLVPNYPLPPSASKPSTPTEMPPSLVAPLSMSDVLKSPPDDDATLPTFGKAMTGSTCSSPPDALTTPSTSAQPSPVFAQPKIGPARPGFLGSTAPRPAAQQKRFDRAFNEVVAGSSPKSPETVQPIIPKAVAPGVLFGSGIPGISLPTTTDGNQKNTESNGEDATKGGAGQGPPPPSGLTNTMPSNEPQPSLFSTHKPWRCPNPGCNKAYRQSNGLKYHQQKGQCDYAQQDAGDLGLSVEEAEERSRPYICAVGAGCTKRYRQMNGLKYHYLNSGAHGQYGLRLLQNGTHPQPQITTPAKKLTPNNTGTKPNPTGNTENKAPATTSTTTPTPRAAAAPYAVPSKIVKTNASPSPMRAVAPAAPRMGVWPTKAVNGTSNLSTNPKSASDLPSQRGKDAVLFAAVGNDPFDVGTRLEI